MKVKTMQEAVELFITEGLSDDQYEYLFVNFILKDPGAIAKVLVARGDDLSLGARAQAEKAFMELTCHDEQLYYEWADYMLQNYQAIRGKLLEEYGIPPIRIVELENAMVACFSEPAIFDLRLPPEENAIKGRLTNFIFELHELGYVTSLIKGFKLLVRWTY